VVQIKFILKHFHQFNLLLLNYQLLKTFYLLDFQMEF